MLLAAEEQQLPVREARAGNPRAWEILFRRFQLPLYVYLNELVRNEQTSLDLVQETFASAARHLHSLEHDEKFGAWLFRIAHQKSIQHWRRQARQRALLVENSETEPADFHPDPSEQLLRDEDQTEFMRSLAALPEHHRAVLLLHYLEDFSLEEITRVTGTPLGTVKSRLFHAKRALRQLLEKNP